MLQGKGQRKSTNICLVATMHGALLFIILLPPPLNKDLDNDFAYLLHGRLNVLSLFLKSSGGQAQVQLSPGREEAIVTWES